MNRQLLLAPLLVAALLLPATSAAASSTPSPSPSAPGGSSAAQNRVTFGIQPAERNRPDGRPTLTVAAKPGQVINDHVAVVNYIQKPLTLAVYARDAFTPAEGGFGLQPAADKPVDLGGWITVAGGSQVDITIPAASEKAPGMMILPIRIAVPRNAQPGDHSAAVLASLSTLGTNPQGQNVRLDQRVGTRVYLRVAGPLQPGLAITGMRTSFDPSGNPLLPGTMHVDYTVENTGNVRLGFQPGIAIQGIAGITRASAHPEPVPELLPGNSQSFSETVTGVWPALRLTTTLTLDPTPGVGAPPVDLAPVTASTKNWVVPWPLIIVILALLAGGWWRRRRRQARTDPGSHAAGSGASEPSSDVDGVPTLDPVGRTAQPPETATAHRQRLRGALVPRGRLAAVTAVLLAPAVGVVVAGSPAHAAGDDRGTTIGTTYLAPVSGTIDSPVEALSSAPCPAGDYFVVRLYGPGLPAEGANINGALEIANLPRTPTGQLYVPFSYVLRDFAQDNVQGGAMRGTYDVVIRCREKLRFTSLGDFVGKLKVTGDTYVVVGAAADPLPYKDPGGGAAQPLVTPQPEASEGTQPGEPQSTLEPSASAPGGQPGATAQPSATAPDAQPADPGTEVAPQQASGDTAGSGDTGGSDRRSWLLVAGGVLLGVAVLLLLSEIPWRRRPAAPVPDDPAIGRPEDSEQSLTIKERNTL